MPHHFDHTDIRRRFGRSRESYDAAAAVQAETAVRLAEMLTLASLRQEFDRIFEIGCGSGLLAIAARLLGAGPTRGVVIDEQAVLATARNAAANRVDVQACLPDDLPAGASQVVVANILSNPLKLLAPMLAARVAPGGRLALSGVLERQADEVCQAYASHLPLHVWAARDGWVCLTGRRD